MQTLTELFSDAVRRYPSRIFLDDGQATYTYAEFDRLVGKLANVFADHGVTKGDPVAIYLPSTVDLVTSYHACQRLGAIVTPLNIMNTQREVGDVMARLRANIVVTGAKGRDVAVALAAESETIRHVLDFDADGESPTVDVRGAMSSASEDFEAVPCDVEDVATVFFSSGTTGTPKGIMQTHRSLWATVRDMSVYNQFRHGRELILTALPMFNNFGATCCMLQGASVGATIRFHERWNTERVLDEITTHRPTHFAGTPTMLTYMVQAFREGIHDLSSLGHVVTGGAPVPGELIAECRDRLGVDVVQIYGATEVSGYMAGEPVTGVRRTQSTGPVFGSARVTVVDPQDVPVRAGSVGEVLIGGDTVGAGYWNDPAATAEAYTPLGWRSGDLGYVDEDGYLFVVDRKKELIICGGFNIHPVEIEGVLFTHDAVAMAAVVGVPDTERGEIPIAFVVASGTPSPGLAEELAAYCRESLAAYKVPREIKFLDEIPLGPTGKVLKRDLRTLAGSR